VEGSANCNFAAASGSGSYVQLQGSTPGVAQTGNFNISGTGILGTLQASIIDRASSGTLTIGNTNATAISLGNTTTNVLTTLNGTTLVKPTIGHDTASVFQVQNASGGNLLTADSSNTAIVLGNDGTPSALTVRGGAATGADVAGANLTFDASNGTGSGGSGDLVFRTSSVASASVSQDAVSAAAHSSSTTSLTIPSFTVGNHANRLLLVGISTNSQGASAVNFGGAALTRLGFVANAGSQAYSEIWYLKLPAVSTATITISFSPASPVVAGAVSLYNVSQSSTFGTLATNSGSTGTATNVVNTTNTDQLIFDSFSFPALVGSWSGGQTELWRNTAFNGGVASKVTASAGSTTVTWNNASNEQWADVAVPINPLSGSSVADTLTDRLHVTSNGYVGINNATPSAALDVQGSTHIKTTTNAANAFYVQNASGSEVLTVDTSGNSVVLGKASTQAGKLTFYNGTNANTAVLQSGVTTTSYTLTLPTAVGSSGQCLQGSVSGSVNSLGWGSCGGGSFVTLQGSTPGTADTGNFNISGVGIAATFQASTFDRATSGTLAIGSTNATAITVGNTTSNVATTINGTALIKPTTGHDSTTAFQVQNASGNNLLTVDSSGTAIVLGNDGTPSALTVRGGAASGTNIAGANLTVDASNGTGSGGSGDIIIRTAGAAAPNTITFDAANGTYSTGTSRTIDNTFSYTIGSGTDRAMCAFLNNGSGATLVSMTYAGTSLSSVGSAGNSVLWCGLIPGTVTAGSHSFSITWSTGDGGMGMGVATYNNVSSIGTPNSATGTSATPTVSVSSNATQMIVDAMANSGANATGAGSGQTIRWQNTTWGGLDGSDKPGQATSTTMSWTLSGSRSWSIIAVPLNPDSGSSTTGDTLTDRLHVTASGNVGINNANPQYTLDVAGTALVKATSTAAFQVQDASSNNILTVDTSDGYIGIGIGNTTPSRTLDVLGTWGGNEDDNQQTNNASGTTTVTDATHALVYHLTALKTSGNNSSTTIFNVTGLPDVNGTFAYFLMQASHNSGLGTSAQQCINAEINGSAQLIGSTVCDTASNSAQHTNFHQFMVMRINNSWTVITSISNSSYPVTAS